MLLFVARLCSSRGCSISAVADHNPKKLATTWAGVLHLGLTFEKVPMGIPPDNAATVITEASLSMPWA
jgi:hypothetical protein